MRWQSKGSARAQFLGWLFQERKTPEQRAKEDRAEKARRAVEAIKQARRTREQEEKNRIAVNAMTRQVADLTRSAMSTTIGTPHNRQNTLDAIRKGVEDIYKDQLIYGDVQVEAELDPNDPTVVNISAKVPVPTNYIRLTLEV